MPTYDPQKNSISVVGNNITGFGKDSIIKAAFNSDAFTLTIGADGHGVRTRNADESGYFEITLLADSPSNDILSGIAIADRLQGTGIGAVLIKDGTGTTVASAQNAWIRKIPDMERGKEMGEVVWTLDTDKLKVFIGGTVQP